MVPGRQDLDYPNQCLAEAVGEQDPQAMRRLLNSARWDENGVPDQLQRFVIERFRDVVGISVADETACWPNVLIRSSRRYWFFAFRTITQSGY
jgi:hypothetical protein